MKNFKLMFRKLLLIIHHCLAFLGVKWFDRWLLPHASCVLLMNNDGQVLAVSRKDDATKFGLPGGKNEKNESDLYTAVRELKEETGIDISWFNLRKIFEDTDDFKYWTTCYYACVVRGYVPNLENKALGESGEIKWVDKEVLTSGIFGTFNTKLFKVLHQIKTELCVFCKEQHV